MTPVLRLNIINFNLLKGFDQIFHTSCGETVSKDNMCHTSKSFIGVFNCHKMYGSLASRTMASSTKLCELKNLVGKLNTLEENVWMCVITSRLIRLSYYVVSEWC